LSTTSPGRLAGIGVELGRVLTDHGPEFTGRAFTSHLGAATSATIASRPGRPTTTRSVNASKGPPCRSSPGPPSTASTSLAWPTSTPSSRAGSSTPTPAAPTTATSCAAARPLRSWRRTDHDQAEGSPVTSTRAQEALGCAHGAGLSPAPCGSTSRSTSSVRERTGVAGRPASSPE
jgi:hypothetical protein